MKKYSRNTDDVLIQCKCNDENGCFWEPSVVNFQCFPFGTVGFIFDKQIRIFMTFLVQKYQTA